MKRQARIWLQSHVEASGHIGTSPHARLYSRRTHPLADHRAELRVAVELAQRDLAGGDEAEEEDERTVLGGQRALRLHAPAELLVQPLDAVGGPERLPLGLRKAEERQQVRAPFLEALDHARTPLPPRPLERGPGRPGRLGTRGVDDPVEVGVELVEDMLGRLALQVPQLVDVMPISA